jgi:MFS family permease
MKSDTKKKMRYALVAGHVVECFDATIYGFYAVILKSFFFPTMGSRSGQILFSFVAFAAGFWIRPLGAVVFGALGDRLGRRKPLIAAMALVGVPTLIIGILPTYDTIGWAATIILVICRLAQGFFYGAEFAGVTVYAYERFLNTGVLGSRMGFLVASGTMGAVLATALGAFFSMEIMPPYAWRIPFIFGGLSAFIVFLLRRQIEETEEFQATAREKKVLSVPLMGVLKRKMSLFISMIICSLATVPLYLVTVYGNYRFRELGYTASQSMLLNMSTLTFDAIVLGLVGFVIDRVGFKKPLILGCAWMFVFAIPAFSLLTYSTSIYSVYAFILLISLGNSMVAPCMTPYVSGLFPTNCRYSGVAFSGTLGMALISGNTPAIATYCVSLFNSQIAPAFWLMFIMGVALLSIYWYENYAKSTRLSGSVSFGR